MKRLKLATVITIISISLMGCSNSEVLNNKTVTIDEAKEIALKYAGVTSDQVSFIKAEMDLDNGIQKYDIEFYHGSKEYDYEINSTNGEIIKYDYDIEYNNNVNNTNNINSAVNISEEQAKEIALKHAGVTSDQVSFIKVEMDLDNGIQKYDIEFYHGSKEYDYEINSANGEIIKYDYDIEYNNNVNNTNNINSAVNISEEQAKEIALKHAGVTSNQVSFIKVEMDLDNGIKKYDIEFYYNNIEYSYEIDTNTGDILSYERD